MNQFDVPILMIVFNRPDVASRVLERVKELKPKKLYIAADGARPHKDGEQELCEKTRTTLVDMVDWDCELKTLFSEKNKGCKLGVKSAIDRMFEHEERGIILEDDCLPDISFFDFCEKLLDKYADDTRITSISGSMPYDDGVKLEESYFFSKYSRIWGWATWKRAWNLFDIDLKDWPEQKKNKVHYSFFDNRYEVKHWEDLWDRCYAGKIDTWDFQWMYAKLLNGTYTIVSSENLVSNIGFAHVNATHTGGAENPAANYPTVHLSEIVHPKYFSANYTRDYWYGRNIYFFSEKNILGKRYRKLKAFLSY